MLISAAILSVATLAASAGLLYFQFTVQRNADRTLHDVKTRIRDIVDSAMDAIITIDHQQRIVMFNNAAENVFRWPSHAVIGKPLDILLPKRFSTLHGQHVQQFGKTGVTSRRMGVAAVLTGLRANGEEFPVEASISQFGEGERKLYTVILRDVTLRVQAETELRQSKQELHELAAAANQLREHEQRRIARELHDELAQALTGLKMDIGWIKNKLPEATPPIIDKLKSMEHLLDNTVAATRRISSALRPMMLDDLGLVPAIEWLVQNFIQHTGIRCELAIASAKLDLQDPEATTVYRILQESLTNIAKHAKASSVEITLAHSQGEIAIGVRDNGVGFLFESPRKLSSYGLIGLRERAYILGGKVQIESAPGKGTYIEVRLPLAGGSE
ncbi:MAG: sensor histidine kinase [Gammaproteobacteria bacterium]|nr:sensor histidine kinase [Gammaproteobacteria bacterium]